MEGGSAIDEAIAAASAKASADAFVTELHAAGVPAEALIEGFSLSPHAQLEARDFFRELDHPLTGRNRYPGLPFNGICDERPRSAPPTLGQHNRDVLGHDLGKDDDAITALEEAGIVVTKPVWA